MARLASSSWTSYCAPTSFNRWRPENFRRCTKNGCRIATRTDFLGVCEARPSLGLRQSRRLQFQERVRVIAGLIEETETEEAQLSEVKVDLEVTNLGNNTRKVEARIAIQAPLEAVWGVLTDYNHLADHIPGLAESRVLELRPQGARLLQVSFATIA